MATKFNKKDPTDLGMVAHHVRNGFVVRDIDDLQDPEVEFCRCVMYWHDHYVRKGWNLPAWAQQPDFQNWLNSFRSSYQSCIFVRDAMQQVHDIP
jgi:hypothetical protein